MDFPAWSASRGHTIQGVSAGTVLTPCRFDGFNQFDFSIMVVPEPGSLTLAAMGLLGLLVLVRQRRGTFA